MDLSKETPETAVQIDDDNLIKDLLILENDVEAEGWDQPARLYAVLGKPGNYYLELITKIEGHPVDFMRGAVCGDPTTGWPGGALDDRVVGVALAVEAWRHPMAEDLEEVLPEMWAYILAGAEKFEVTDQDEILDIVQNTLYKMYAGVAPSNNPKRIELRTVQVVMRDDTTIGIMRDRDKQPHVVRTGKEVGRMPKAMKALLTGCWPNDPDLAPDEEEA